MTSLAGAFPFAALAALFCVSCSPYNPYDPDDKDDAEEDELVDAGTGADAGSLALQIDTNSELPVLARDRSCTRAQPCTRLNPSTNAQLTEVTGPLASAIRTTELYAIEAGVRAGYFAQKLDSVPVWNPDLGARQWFQGAAGLGAIYAHEQSNGARITMPIYGDILSTWSRYGWENVLGYPQSPEQDASDRGGDTSCLSRGGVRQQVFGYVAWTDADGSARGSEVVLCWAPATGTRVLPETVQTRLDLGEAVWRHDL